MTIDTCLSQYAIPFMIVLYDIIARYNVATIIVLWGINV